MGADAQQASCLQLTSTSRTLAAQTLMDLNVVLVRKQYGKQFVLVSVPKVVMCFISQPGFLKMRLRDAFGCGFASGVAE